MCGVSFAQFDIWWYLRFCDGLTRTGGFGLQIHPPPSWHILPPPSSPWPVGTQHRTLCLYVFVCAEAPTVILHVIHEHLFPGTRFFFSDYREVWAGVQKCVYSFKQLDCSTWFCEVLVNRVRLASGICQAARLQITCSLAVLNRNRFNCYHLIWAIWAYKFSISTARIIILIFNTYYLPHIFFEAWFSIEDQAYAEDGLFLSARHVGVQLPLQRVSFAHSLVHADTLDVSFRHERLKLRIEPVHYVS